MKKLILMLCTLISFTFATGYSMAEVTIVPVAETDSYVICKYLYWINPGGWGMEMPHHLGWIAADSNGVQIEFEIAVLEDQGVPISMNDTLQAKLDDFQALTNPADIPESIRSFVNEPITIINEEGSWQREYPFPYNFNVVQTEAAERVISVRGLESPQERGYYRSDAEEIILYSNNGVELVHTVLSECYLNDTLIGEIHVNGVFLYDTLEIQTLMPEFTPYDSYDFGIDTYKIDAFRFSGQE